PAQPAAPSAQRSAARVSLTGEVVESDAPAVNAAPSVYSTHPQSAVRPAAPIPARPVPTAAVRTPYRPVVQPADALPQKSYALVINLSVVLFLLLLSGGGGWWLWAHRTHPKPQVQRYIHAIQWL